MNTEQSKSNGEHILDIAAMKYFNDACWQDALNHTIPKGLQKTIVAEIDRNLARMAVSTAWKTLETAAP